MPKIPSKSILLSLTLLLVPHAEVKAMPHTAAELEKFFSSGRPYSPFCLSGVVQHVESASGWFCLQDETGRSFLRLSNGIQPPASGDEIVVRGDAATTKESEPVAYVSHITRIGRKAVTPALDLRIAKLDEQKHNLAIVRIAGTVIDILTDEIDPKISFLLVKDGESILPVAFNKDAFASESTALVNAQVRLSGIFYRSINGLRKFSGPIVYISKPAALEVLRQPPDDPFDVPQLEQRLYLTPRDVSRLDRRRVSGRVAAVWEGNHILVATDDKRTISVELASDETPPPCGTRIQAAGYPEADILSIKLTRARCRALAGTPPPDDEPTALSAPGIVSGNWHDRNGKPLHGKLIRLAGLVRSVPTPTGNDRRALLDSDGVNVPVDISANPPIAERLAVGCRIEVVGRCLLETENWRPENPFPRITGFRLVPRSPDDVRVVSRPPWWTPARLLAVIGVFVALLAGMFVWNAILRRLVERRSRALYREQLARERSDLRVEDRTRLAVELHDSISQNLTGASLQIDTVRKLMNTDAAQASRHLDIASKTLTSCRQELRNCIWDLRNSSLDERDLNTAIRRTIELYTGDAELQIRFNVSRSRLSDNTTHALMRIVRELAANAVRHGRARHVEVRGSRQAAALVFTVQDDGAGFDAAHAAGLSEGHFGLSGIRERTAHLEGTFDIASAPGKGTTATVTIPAPPSPANGKAAT